MQSAWQFHYEGDPHDALEATQSIKGILGRELVSLQELIDVFQQCTPEAEKVSITATESVGKTCYINMQATFNSVAEGGDINYADAGIPAEVKTRIGTHKEIEQWLRWSGRNACDQVNLTSAPWMTLFISQKIEGGSTTATVNYSFPYNP